MRITRLRSNVSLIQNRGISLLGRHDWEVRADKSPTGAIPSLRTGRGGVRFIRLPADNRYDDAVLSVMEMAKIDISCRYL